jgi:hypothetical protein
MIDERDEQLQIYQMKIEAEIGTRSLKIRAEHKPGPHYIAAV